jgi:uncharacterized tellurite resistance protein B-like protein
MIEAINRFFSQHMNPEVVPETDRDHAARLACAALLVEMSQLGDSEDRAQSTVLEATVRQKFDLSAGETHELLELARTEQREAVDYYQFTSLIRDHFDYPDRVRLIEALWRVAYADNELEPLEEHMVRKIADLLYVEHSDFITAKLRLARP